LQALCRWGEAQIAERWKAPETFMMKMPEDLAPK
jgi:hypothetical protein